MAEIIDPKGAAIPAVLAKLDQVLGTWWQADQDEKRAEGALADAKSRKATADAQIKACFDAATLFGFDLKFEWDKWIERLHNENEFGAAPTNGEAKPSLDVPMPIAPKTIKDRAVEAAKQAYPKPIRASALRQQLEAVGIKTHEKTVGMTLYRLLTDGVLRREGWDWFFVPEAERQAAPARQGEESSGCEPELSLAAE